MIMIAIPLLLVIGNALAREYGTSSTATTRSTIGNNHLNNHQEHFVRRLLDNYQQQQQNIRLPSPVTMSRTLQQATTCEEALSNIYRSDYERNHAPCTCQTHNVTTNLVVECHQYDYCKECIKEIFVTEPLCGQQSNTYIIGESAQYCVKFGATGVESNICLVTNHDRRINNRNDDDNDDVATATCSLTVDGKACRSCRVMTCPNGSPNPIDYELDCSNLVNEWGSDARCQSTTSSLLYNPVTSFSGGALTFAQCYIDPASNTTTTTNAPVSKAPVSNAPISKAPVSIAPISRAPVSKTPVSKVPVSKAPVSVAKAPAVVSTAPVAPTPAVLDQATKVPSRSNINTTKVPTNSNSTKVPTNNNSTKVPTNNTSNNGHNTTMNVPSSLAPIVSPINPPTTTAPSTVLPPSPIVGLTTDQPVQSTSGTMVANGNNTTVESNAVLGSARLATIQLLLLAVSIDFFL